MIEEGNYGIKISAEFDKKLEIVGASDNFKNCRFVIVSMRITSYEEYSAENMTINGTSAEEKIINSVLRFFKDYSLDTCCVHSVRGKFKFAVYSGIYDNAAELIDFLDTKLKELEAYMKNELNVEQKSHISAGYSDAVGFFRNEPVEQPDFEGESRWEESEKSTLKADFPPMGIFVSK